PGVNALKSQKSMTTPGSPIRDLEDDGLGGKGNPHYYVIQVMHTHTPLMFTIRHSSNAPISHTSNLPTRHSGNAFEPESRC
ncbi:hypothetical protein, partial [Shewanella sp. S1-58-MNA-CIBAN-0166]|uniref:hypothetical protein n=1 Tax=Shewanella sp. S1-58-MNA-CIBAN-0166 TaxID=3140467 RepID=UPI00332812E9